MGVPIFRVFTVVYKDSRVLIIFYGKNQHAKVPHIVSAKYESVFLYNGFENLTSHSYMPYLTL